MGLAVSGSPRGASSPVGSTSTPICPQGGDGAGVEGGRGGAAAVEADLGHAAVGGGDVAHRRPQDAPAAVARADHDDGRGAGRAGSSPTIQSTSFSPAARWPSSIRSNERPSPSRCSAMPGSRRPTGGGDVGLRAHGIGSSDSAYIEFGLGEYSGAKRSAPAHGPPQQPRSPIEPLEVLGEDLRVAQATAQAAQQDAVQGRPGLGQPVVDPQPLLAARRPARACGGRPGGGRRSAGAVPGPRAGGRRRPPRVRRTAGSGAAGAPGRRTPPACGWTRRGRGWSVRVFFIRVVEYNGRGPCRQPDEGQAKPDDAGLEPRSGRQMVVGLHDPIGAGISTDAGS